jgi:NNP family nitrate/nitrite transporter-like MFS transporter
MQTKGTPSRALFAATLGFFAGFAAVALFGPTAKAFGDRMGLGPMALGFLVAMPALSGSLLRIPFSAWVDTTGGRKPFLILLALSVAGMAGLTAVVWLAYPDGLTASFYPLLLGLGVLCGCGIATFSVGVSQVAYWFPRARQGRALAIFAGFGNLAPGLFTLLLPFAMAGVGLAGSYVAWLAFLTCGTALYWALGRNAWYFQHLAEGTADLAARKLALDAGQELFPRGSLADSLRISARNWHTWALVCVYFSTFGGFIALTAWLPAYWTSFHGMSLAAAGALTALYSLLTSLVRIGGGILADKLREGGENTAILAIFIMLVGALMMSATDRFQLAIPAVVLLAIGMGVANAAVFKLVPQEVPEAIGGAAGWVGGLGAFGGFVIPPMMAFAVGDIGKPGYQIGFVVFTFLAVLSLFLMWMLKYTHEPPVDVIELLKRLPREPHVEEHQNA